MLWRTADRQWLFFDKAKKNAKLNVKNFTDAIEKYDAPIISTSSTCSFTLREEYPEVLKVDNSQVADKLEFVTRFLLKSFMNGNAPKMKPINKKVVYHTPCHLERTGGSCIPLNCSR